MARSVPALPKTGLHLQMLRDTPILHSKQAIPRITIMELPTIPAQAVQVLLRLQPGRSLITVLPHIVYLIFGTLPATIPAPLILQKVILPVIQANRSVLLILADTC